MIFAKERVEVIAAQLKQFMIPQKFQLTDWQMKEGFYLRPQEADSAEEAWLPFDSLTMHWYGKDRHYWFRTQFTVPESYAGKTLWLYLHTQIQDWDDGRNPQFLVFVNGEVVQGADMNHREVKLADQAEAGKVYTIDLQAYSGILHTEFQLLADVMEVSEPVKDLYYDLQVPLWALSRMDQEGKTAIDLLSVMNETINLLDLRDVHTEAFYASVEEARAYIARELYEKMGGFDEIIATCIGHTHIDVAWWWTVAQTREKTARSFSTVLKLMEEYPEYKFMSSQPVLYTFLKARYPELYAKVKERVAEGRWEPEGSMWLEADCNLTSGESLTRQFLYGKRFFKEEFGVDNKVLWLPDVFGYSGALPQIMKKCGVDYFMTTKLSWNQFNKVPNDTLLWEGIDGSKVLTHFVSTLSVGQSPKRFFTTYNGMLHPDAIMGGWERYQNKEMNNDILISFGYGDGGGGPTREMLETGRRMEKGIKGVPKVRQEGSLTYFKELEEKVGGHKRLQTWTGEFYFEYHRGTYTSMARNKRSNRKSELGLMDLELLCVLTEGMGLAYPAEKLEQMWKVVLLNQFHDILPGSSIKEVYEVTKEEYAQLAADLKEMIGERLKLLAGEGDGVTIVNTLGHTRSALAALPEGVEALQTADGEVLLTQEIGKERYAYVKDIPAKGFCVLQPVQKEEAATVFAFDGRQLETPYYTAVIDEDGCLSRLYDKENDREVLQEGRLGNELRVFEDKPMYFDNWDIDVYYTEKSWHIGEVTDLHVSADGPLAMEVTVERAFMHSKMIQKIRFYANSRRIDFDTWVDWKEHQHLLKVFFPVDVHTDEAAFDIQFGNVTRKTHTNTSWDMARFESCGHKWVDVSEGGYGVSLLNDCKYGHSIHEGEIGLTLIKSGIEPNPDTDVEEHFFTYSLYPHSGTWKEADTQKEAMDLNQPLYSVRGGKPECRNSFIQVDQDNVVVETIKRAEDGEGIIVRMYESRNCRTKAKAVLAGKPAQVFSCNLLEEKEAEVPVCGQGFAFEIKPYEIQTYYIK